MSEMNEDLIIKSLLNGFKINNLNYINQTLNVEIEKISRVRYLVGVITHQVGVITHVVGVISRFMKHIGREH